LGCFSIYELTVTKTAQVFIDIFDAYDKNISKISSVVNNDLCDAAIIMTVSAQEVLFTDLFKEYKPFWFTSKAGGHINSVTLEKRLEIKKELRAFLISIKAYDDFLKNYYVYQDQIDPDIDSVYEALFPGSISKLNFQNLSDNRGVREAYKLFFNVDLMEILDPVQNKSYDKWKELILFYGERHEIIHKGKTTSYSQNKIKDTLKSLIYMRDRLSEIVMPCYHCPDDFLTPPVPNCFIISYYAKENLLG